MTAFFFNVNAEYQWELSNFQLDSFSINNQTTSFKNQTTQARIWVNVNLGVELLLISQNDISTKFLVFEIEHENEQDFKLRFLQNISTNEISSSSFTASVFEVGPNGNM